MIFKLNNDTIKIPLAKVCKESIIRVALALRPTIIAATPVVSKM